MVWDYHVILIIRPRRKEQTIEAEKSKKQSWVYDFDTTLGLPRSWEGTCKANSLVTAAFTQTPEYFRLTFPEDLLPAYDGCVVCFHARPKILIKSDSQFRVVGGEIFIQNFASDRSHMVNGIFMYTAGTDHRPFYQLKTTEFTGTKGPEPGVSLSPPPSYAPICGPSAMQKGIRNNLMKRYVTMSTAADSDSQVYGVVLDRESADDFFAGN